MNHRRRLGRITGVMAGLVLMPVLGWTGDRHLQELEVWAPRLDAEHHLDGPFAFVQWGSGQEHFAGAPTRRDSSAERSDPRDAREAYRQCLEAVSTRHELCAEEFNAAYLLCARLAGPNAVRQLACATTAAGGRMSCSQVARDQRNACHQQWG